MQSFIKKQYSTEDNDNRKHILLWSGGCDSTLLLYELLDAYGSENVIAISYKYPWLDSTKSKTEDDYREAFKSKMKLIGDRYANFQHHIFMISELCNSENESGNAQLQNMYGVPQALGWLFMVPMYAETDAYIYSGYIKDDSFTSVGFKQYYENIFESVNKLIGKDSITLRLPYIDRSKYEIIEQLIKYDLYDNTWYCEMPVSKHKMCMKCHPCKTHLSALTYLSMFSDDEYVKTSANKKLEYIKSLQLNDDHTDNENVTF